MRWHPVTWLSLLAVPVSGLRRQVSWKAKRTKYHLVVHDSEGHSVTGYAEVVAKEVIETVRMFGSSLWSPQDGTFRKAERKEWFRARTRRREV